MRLTRPRFAWAVACLVAACALVSCTPRKSAERPPVEFWVSWPVEAVAPIVQRFEAENPGVRVRLHAVPWDAADDSLSLALRTGRLPDLCQLTGARMPDWLAGSSLSDWSAGVADLRTTLRGWDLCMVGDAIYGLPWTLRAPVLVYERRLFARAGLDSSRAPATWDELRTAAAKLHRLPGVQGFGVATGSARELTREWLPWLWSDDGDLFTAGLDTSRLAEPAAAEALELLLALKRSGLGAPRDSLERAFLAGQLGMLIADASLADAAARAGLRASVALIPPPTRERGSSASWADGEVLVSFTDSRHKEQALKLARFLVQPANAQALAAAVRQAWPSRVDAESTAWYSQNPAALVTLRQIATSRYAPRRRDWPVLESRLGDAIWETLSGSASVAGALASADSFVVSQLGSR